MNMDRETRRKNLQDLCEEDTQVILSIAGPKFPSKPSKTFVNFWLYEEDPKISENCPHPEWKGGKWMMFYDSPNIDKKWEQAVNLYREGKLSGVHAMKVSTMRENLNSKNRAVAPHVIIFYCGPSDNREWMMKIGQNLQDHMKYKNFDGTMLYKADVCDDIPFDNRTVMNKSMKTNAKYRLRVPRY